MAIDSANNNDNTVIKQVSNDANSNIEVESPNTETEVVLKAPSQNNTVESDQVTTQTTAEHVEADETTSTSETSNEPFCEEFPTDSGQEGGIWSILTCVMCVVFKLVDALKKYASDIAQILVGTMLGGAIARFGRRMFRQVAGLISL